MKTSYIFPIYIKNYIFILLSFCFTWLNCRKFGPYLRQNLGSQQNIILMC